MGRGRKCLKNQGFSRYAAIRRGTHWNGFSQIQKSMLYYAHVGSRRPRQLGICEVDVMRIECVWEHNGNDSILYSCNIIGAFTRGRTKEEAIGTSILKICTFPVKTGTTHHSSYIPLEVYGFGYMKEAVFIKKGCGQHTELELLLFIM